MLQQKIKNLFILFVFCRPTAMNKFQKFKDNFLLKYKDKHRISLYKKSNRTKSK